MDLLIQNVKEDRGRTLVSYLNIYLNKPDLRMKPIMKRMKYSILRDEPISERQLSSVMKFLEREPEFRSWGRDHIYDYFSPLMEEFFINTRPEPSTLEPFFV